MTDQELHEKSINTLRFLSADAVQNANSGHPGLPMGMAAPAYVVWTRHMKYDPSNPKWPNRDRFILSAGHGSMLLYSLLHLTGFDLSMEDIKNFRQWGFPTAGHPEYWEAPGIETTTGPLGQGFANGVGMAIASEHMAALYNREGFSLFDNYTYAIVSDGDLMEGISHEAAALAGHLKLGNLIYLYDDNRITIDGSTELAWSEDRGQRFEAYGWQVLQVDDANDLEAVDKAIAAAKVDPRPSLIQIRSQIGYGMPNKQNTAAAHGEPPGLDELAAAKENLGWPQEPWFHIPDGVREHFEASTQAGIDKRQQWEKMLVDYEAEYPELAAQLERTLAGRLPPGLAEKLPKFEADEKGLASRAAYGQVLNAVADEIPELLGGSADLTGSNKTDIKGEEPFSAADRTNRYLHYGVREHGMGAIMTGIALYGGLIPYGGTFLVFSDYLRPTIRLAAMSHQGPIYIFTHDSIGLGEDGPTHQPIEHLASLRAIPNLITIRPADANETAQAWLAALERRDGPTALVLTRQNIPTFDRDKYASADNLHKGGYVMADLGEGPLDLVLMATGSELQLVANAAEKLVAEGRSVRLVSMPSWELFEAQPESYRNEVLPPQVANRIAVEAGSPFGWERYVGEQGRVIGLERYGASAPYEQIYEHLGLTVDRILEVANELLVVDGN